MSSFSKFYYIISQILDKDICPQIIPRVHRRKIAAVTGNFFASFQKHYLVVLAYLLKNKFQKNARFAEYQMPSVMFI